MTTRYLKRYTFLLVRQSSTSQYRWALADEPGTYKTHANARPRTTREREVWAYSLDEAKAVLTYWHGPIWGLRRGAWRVEAVSVCRHCRLAYVAPPLLARVDPPGYCRACIGLADKLIERRFA